MSFKLDTIKPTIYLTAHPMNTPEVVKLCERAGFIVMFILDDGAVIPACDWPGVAL